MKHHTYIPPLVIHDRECLCTPCLESVFSKRDKDDGYRQRSLGYRKSHNPYKRGSKNYVDWLIGWNDADIEISQRFKVYAPAFG